ncbi:ORF6N domain-containing protein [Methylorubrum salsuginis]|uniref:ORF6N domain-containing protein n=2 Tax=Methylorubrum salsuginis TaxID=414703 RepID=A0A1I4FP09_9HYPH|nr:ORF6N domain-containing protein [Methylorubrum salsuginis]
MARHNSSPPTVSIGGVDLSRIEFRGEQVVTFAQVDRVHERPEGTARRTFNDNRSRFVEGEDYTTEKLDVLRTAFPGAFPARGGGDVTLITKRGYLKLVKPMSDDRAWAVQGEMIDRYFAIERAAEMAPKAGNAEMARIARAREARLSFNGFLKICRMIGVTGNHAVLSADGATREMTGVSMLGLLKTPRLESDIGGAQITVTDIGRALGLSARETNKALIDHGFQTAFRDAKDRIVYEPTDKGREHGGRMAATGKKHHNGTPVTQLIWSTATTEALRGDLGTVTA